MDTKGIKELETRIAELRRRIPPHSIPPSLFQELEELEEKLEKLKKADKNDDAQKDSSSGL